MAKKIIIILVALAIIIGGGIFYIQSKDNKHDVMDKRITLEEYKKYDKYGFNYSGDETSIYLFVKGIIDINKLEKLYDTDEMTIYSASRFDDFEAVKDNLPLCKTIREISYNHKKELEIDSYYICYYDMNNDEVTLTYFSDGSVTKAVYFAKSDKLVLVTDKLKQDIYYNLRK